MRVLPDWVERVRSEQEYAIGKVKEAFEQGAKAVFIDGPTGVGKTLIPELVRQDLKLERALYACSGHDLQDQFIKDFPHAYQLRGRVNYPTQRYPQEFPKITAADCTKHRVERDGVTRWECYFCDSWQECPYEITKQTALTQPLICTNINYFLAEANYVGRFSNAFDLVTIDEADTLDQQLMKHVEIRVPRSLQKELRVGPPKYSTKPEAWSAWYRQILARLDVFVTGYDPDPDAVMEVKLKKTATSLYEQLKDVGDINEDWHYVGADTGAIVFRPVEPAPFGPAKLWQHSSKFILMSATLISGDAMADTLGLTDPYEVVYLPSPFPKENRPVRMVPVVDMSWKKREKGIDRLVQSIKKILDVHEGERVLIHTHTYKLAEQLEKSLNHGRTFMYRNKAERALALEDFREYGGVLLAPSMERGIDLPDDLCRVIIVCQIPYPYIGDKQIAKRTYGTGQRGRRWFLGEAVRTLVQMTGRGVRHETDHAVTYVLDSRAPKFLAQCKREGLLPKWWADAFDQKPWLKELGLERK